MATTNKLKWNTSKGKTTSDKLGTTWSVWRTETDMEDNKISKERNENLLPNTESIINRMDYILCSSDTVENDVTETMITTVH